MYRIFLVEDDYSLAQAMSNQLEGYGNEVYCAKDFQNISEECSALQPHLVLMDIMLPYKDGYYWCNEIRRSSMVPIIFISSASGNMNIVMAINMGGDDFIPKPVDSMVLNAKVQAVLRRTYELGSPTSLPEFHGAFLNCNDGTLRYGEHIIELTKNEQRILSTLLENHGRIVSRDRLMMRLWQDDCYVEENTLTVNVARLRKKLEEYGLKDVILTKPGQGYILS